MNSKKIRKSLILLSIPTAVVTTTIASFEYEKNTIEIVNKNKNAAQPQAFTPNTNVNWVDQTDRPDNFDNTNPLFATDNSPAVVTSYGFFGSKKLDDKDNRMIYMTSFSGVVLWWQKINVNPVLKKFYSDNSMTIDNVVVQQFAYLKDKDALVLLVGDGNIDNQSIVVLDARTGLIWNPIVDDHLDITKPTIFKVKDTMYPNNQPADNQQQLDRMYTISSNAIIVNKFGTYDVYKNAIRLVLNKGANDTNPEKIEIKNLGQESDKNNILYSLNDVGKGKCIAVTVDGAADPSDSKNYKQRIRNFDASGINSNVGSPSNLKELSNQYIKVDAENENSYMNYSFVVDNKAYIVTGNKNTRSINEISLSNYSENSGKRVDMAGHDINTITSDPITKCMYIGNKTSSANIPLGYINTTASNPRFTQFFSTTTTIQKPYFAIPVLEKLGNSTQQNILYVNDAKQFTYLYRTNGQSDFLKASDTFSFVGINGDVIKKLVVKGNGLFADRMASNINVNDVNGVLNKPNYSKGNFDVSIENTSNDNFGTASIKLKISYPWMYDQTQKSSFYAILNLNGFYEMSQNFSFKFITQSSDDEAKFNKIQELKRTKFANRVTQEEVNKSFWKGTIKNKNKTNDIAITSNMFSLSNSDNLGTLTVTLNLPSDQLPQGFPKLSIKQSYDGFLSTAGYEVNVKNDNEINSIISSIYPSKLTLTTLLSFVDLGNKVKKESQYWDVSITNQDDFEGTATISLSYKYNNDSEVPDKENFPVNRFTIFTNKQLTGFKNIKSQLQQKPTMDHFDSDFLPSEIWEQYQSKVDSGDANSTLLLQHLTSLTIVDKNDVNITIKNPNTCDADKKLTLELDIKNNAKLTINYDGIQFQKSDDNKLVFNQNLKDKFLTVENYYPWTIEWSIATKDKQFEVLGPGGNFIQQTDNTYYINVRDLPSDQQYLIKKNQYASDVSQDVVSQLIKVQGYNYKYLEYDVNESKGYVLAVIQLSSLNPNGASNLLKSKTNSNLKNKNFERKIYIYNFKLPLPAYVNIVIYTIIAIALVAAATGGTTYFFWYRKKHKYNKMGIDLKQQLENKRKLLLMKKKIDLTERIKQQNQSLKRKR